MKVLLPPLLDPQAPFVSLYVRFHAPSGVVELGDLLRGQLKEGTHQIVGVELALLVKPPPHHGFRLASITMGHDGHTELLALGGAFPPVFLDHATRQILSPSAPITLANKVVATPDEPVEVMVGAKTPIEAHEYSPALFAFLGQTQDALDLLEGLFENLTGVGIARIELLEEHFSVVGSAHPHQLPSRGIALPREVSLRRVFGPPRGSEAGEVHLQNEHLPLVVVVGGQARVAPVDGLDGPAQLIDVLVSEGVEGLLDGGLLGRALSPKGSLEGKVGTHPDVYLVESRTTREDAH